MAGPWVYNGQVIPTISTSEPFVYNGQVWPKFTITANFITDVISGNIPLTVHFTDQTITDDTIISYSWDFGDGGTSIDQNPTHIYERANVYDVVLTVTTNTGVIESVTKSNYISTYYGTPTYLQNTGTIILPARTQAIPPNICIELGEYISPHEYPEVQKVANGVTYKNAPIALFSDKSGITLFSQIYTYISRMLFIVQDSSTPCVDGDSLTLTIVGGVTDSQLDFSILNSLVFTRQSFTDYDGDAISIWTTNSYPDDIDIRTHYFKFWSVAVTAASLSGTVDISYKFI